MMVVVQSLDRGWVLSRGLGEATPDTIEIAALRPLVLDQMIENALCAGTKLKLLLAFSKWQAIFHHVRVNDKLDKSPKEKRSAQWRTLEL